MEKKSDENPHKMKTMETTKIREPEFQNPCPLWSRIPAEVAPAQELKVCREPGRVGWVGHDTIVFEMG